MEMVSAWCLPDHTGTFDAQAPKLSECSFEASDAEVLCAKAHQKLVIAHTFVPLVLQEGSRKDDFVEGCPALLGAQRC